MDSSHLLKDLIILRLKPILYPSFLWLGTKQQSRLKYSQSLMSISFRLLSQHSSATRSSTLRDRHRDLDNPRFFRQSQQHAPKSHRRIHVSTKLSDRRQAMPRSQVQLMPHARLQCLQHFADLRASMNAREVIHIAGATGICKAIDPHRCRLHRCRAGENPPGLELSASSPPAAVATDSYLPAPMPDRALMR